MAMKPLPPVRRTRAIVLLRQFCTAQTGSPDVLIYFHQQERLESRTYIQPVLYTNPQPQRRLGLGRFLRIDHDGDFWN